MIRPESSQPVLPSPSSQLPNTPLPRQLSEDWWAVILGCGILIVGLTLVLSLGRATTDAKSGKAKIASPWKNLIGKPGSWRQPADLLGKSGAVAQWSIVGAGIITCIGVLPSLWLTSAGHALRFVKAYPFLFLLAALAYLMSEQEVVKSYGLESALWALVLGLLLCNTIGTPAWLTGAIRTELFIKIGLVLLGAEVLLGQLIVLGIPGICTAWIVTPIVLVTTYWFGQHVLQIESKSLNIVIAADMSVCGVSAAIATAAACKAKKEELSLAVGISLAFTVLMMVVMPPVIRWLQLSPAVGGAWIGGTIDSTGAVAAAGTLVGPEAEKVAVTVKMIQNILIGAVAFCVAAYWVRFVEPSDTPHVNASEIWRRFPKFILGFVGASVAFSLLRESWPQGPAIVESVINDCSKTLRGWYFSLAFVCIGLETNVRELVRYLKSGKALVLYVCGQLLNLTLTLAMAKLMFDVLFFESVQKWLRG